MDARRSLFTAQEGVTIAWLATVRMHSEDNVDIFDCLLEYVQYG